jgi:DNA-binding transcriptional LysR family regulator
VDISALKTFLEVAKTRHFGHAAENLFVSQSTVSARIKALEDGLATELFVRERSNIHLTKSGEALVSHAKSILTLWGRACHEVAMPEDVVHTLTIGGLSGLWDISLQDWLANVSKMDLPLAITADTYGTSTMLQRIMSGSMDLAFVYDAPQGLNLISQPLKTIQLRLVSSRAAESVDSALDSGFIQVNWGLNFGVQFAAQFPQIRATRLTTGLGRIAINYLKNNIGSAYLAESAVASAITEGQLFYVKDAPVFERKAYAIYHQENEKVDLIQKLIEDL